MGTKDTLTAFGRKIMKQFETLEKKPYVKIGFPAGKGDHPRTGFEDPHKPEPGEKTAPHMTVGQIAAVHEFGSSDGTIPARAPLRKTYDEKKGEWRKKTETRRKRVVEGKETVEKALGLLGQGMSADVKMTIKKRLPPPLKPATLKRKTNAKGQTADVPLIWRGQMVNSVTYKVMPKGDKK